MIFVADASVARPLVDLLRRRGHRVVAISEIQPDMPDEGVLKTAFEQEAILISEDKDFGELVIRQGHPTHGVILLRLSGMNRSQRASMACEQIERLEKRVKGAMTVIEAGQVRVRPI